VRTYKRGDYSAALVSVHTLAKRGNVRATYYLGEMYRNGHGVPKRDYHGLKMVRISGRQGPLGVTDSTRYALRAG